MRQAREDMDEKAARAAGRALWRRSCVTDAPEDEEGRLLDLAGFADGRLDPDEHDRVAATLASDPDAAADVAMARALAHGAAPAAGIDHIVARAVSLDAAASAKPGRIVLVPGATRPRLLVSVAQWGSLAAAVALACWLGFAMGTDASLALSGHDQTGERTFLPELFDPSSGFFREPGEESRT